jgi:hypothetical protein
MSWIETIDVVHSLKKRPPPFAIVQHNIVILSPLMWSVFNALNARHSFDFSNRVPTINGANITISPVNFRMLEKRPRRLLRMLTKRLRTHSMVICEIYLQNK